MNVAGATSQLRQASGQQWPGAARSAAGHQPASVQFQTMVEQVLLGSMPAAVANRIAVSQEADAEAMGQPMHPEMHTLAALGDHGQYPGNVWRDLEVKLNLGSSTFPEPFSVDLPLLDHSQHPCAVTHRPWPFLLLQDVLHWAYHLQPAEFRRRFLGEMGEEALPMYWQALRADDPRLVHHPVTTVPDWQQWAIPGRLHADAVPYAKGKHANVTVHNLSSVLAEGATLDCLNLWFWLPKTLICKPAEHGGHDTWGLAWKIAIWDILCCLRGEFLPFDWAGNAISPGHPRYGKKGRIMGKHVFALIQFTADTEHFANSMGLRHWSAHQPCEWCPASGQVGSSMPFSDFNDHAEWMQHLLTLDEWEANPTRHPLWEAHPLTGLTIFSICLDILHVLDLGVLTYMLGSTIWTLVHESCLPGPFHARSAYRQVRTHCPDAPCLKRHMA